MNISEDKWVKIVGIVLSAALAIAAVLGWYLPIEVPEERAVRERIAIDSRNDCYLYNGADWYSYSDDHSTQKFHVDGATGNLDVEGTANFAGAVTFQSATTMQAGGLTITTDGVTLSDGDMVIADDLRITAQTSITVTNGAAFTPTGTYQPITAAGEVTPTVTVGTAGDVLAIINTSNTTVNFADSGTMMLDSAVALTQYDSLVLWCDGTNWIKVGGSTN